MIELFGLLIIAIVLFVVGPFINFIIGWITGWLISNTFAATFLTGLDFLGITLTINEIPILCGVLNVIGNFFKSSRSSKLDNEIDKLIDSL